MKFAKISIKQHASSVKKGEKDCELGRETRGQAGRHINVRRMHDPAQPQKNPWSSYPGTERWAPGQGRFRERSLPELGRGRAFFLEIPHPGSSPQHQHKMTEVGNEETAGPL